MKVGDGVTFGDYHTYDDWGLILCTQSVGSPEAKTETVSVPGMNGVLDLTEALNSETVYENRTLSFEFLMLDTADDWASRVSEIANALHGQKMKIVLDDDAEFYYYGRVAVNEYKSNSGSGTLVIECDCEPYKVDINSLTGSDWEWDPFSFVSGVIYTTEVEVDGETTVTLFAYSSVCPTFTTSASGMTVTYEGETYDLDKGENQIDDLYLQAGENELTFDGDGTVEIDYESRSL